jgi:hypothetical protein
MQRTTVTIRATTANTVETVTLPDRVFRYRMKRLSDYPIFASFTSGDLPVDLNTLERAPNGDYLVEDGIIVIPRSTWYDTGQIARIGTFYYSTPFIGAGFSLELWLANAALVNAYDAGGGLGGFGS